MPTTAAATSAGDWARPRAQPWLPAAAWTVALIVFGAMVTFPAPIPGGPAGLRTTEFVGLAANGALALALLSGTVLHRAAVPIGVAALLTIPWIWAEVISISTMTGGGAAQFAMVRWLMGLATGYWLAVLMDDERCRRILGKGLILGLLCSLAVVMHDAMTFDLGNLDKEQLSETTEEKLTHHWVEGEYRASGPFGHPNNAAAIILLIVPLVIGLVEERRLPRVAVLIAAVAIGAVFFATKTRGPTMIATVVLAWHLWRGSSMRKVVIVLALALALGGVAVGSSLPTGGGNDVFLQRFTDTGVAASENADGRLLTTLSSLELALVYPLGLGSSYVGVLKEYTGGWTSTHNAYGQLALMGGIPLALFAAVRLLANAVRPASPARVTESWTAFYVAGAFLFENLFFAPSFTLFTIWLLWRPSGSAAMATMPRTGGVAVGRAFVPGPNGPAGGAAALPDRMSPAGGRRPTVLHAPPTPAKRRPAVLRAPPTPRSGPV